MLVLFHVVCGQKPHQGATFLLCGTLKARTKLAEQCFFRQQAKTVFRRPERAWQTNDACGRVLVGRVKRTRPWYWMSEAGGCYFSAWYGSKMLELKPGMTAIQVNKREDPPTPSAP